MPEPSETDPLVGAAVPAKTEGRILVADDDPVFRQSLASLLKRAGYEILTAGDARGARELLETSGFDLVVADIDMPGNETLQFVRDLPSTAVGIPLILLTGHPSMESAIDAVQLPVTAYLRKPPDPTELLRLVSQSIANFRIYRAVSSTRQDLQNRARQLEDLEGALRETPGESHRGAVNASLAIVLENLLSGLLNLKQLVVAIGRQEGSDASFRSEAQTTAIHEAIEVLEKTKRSFKSSELATLRRKLEALVESEILQSPS